MDKLDHYHNLAKRAGHFYVRKSLREVRGSVQKMSAMIRTAAQHVAVHQPCL